MDKRQARRLARSVAADALRREIHNHGLVQAIADSEGVKTQKEFNRLWNAFQDVLLMLSEPKSALHRQNRR